MVDQISIPAQPAVIEIDAIVSTLRQQKPSDAVRDIAKEAAKYIEILFSNCEVEL